MTSKHQLALEEILRVTGGCMWSCKPDATFKCPYCVASQALVPTESSEEDSILDQIETMQFRYLAEAMRAARRYNEEAKK